MKTIPSHSLLFRLQNLLQRGHQALTAAVTLAGLVFAGQTAGATSYISVSSGLWSNPATWSPNGTPGSTDIIEIQAGNLVTNNSSGLTFGTVTIDSGGVLKIAASITCRVLTNNGTLTIGTGTTARTLSITTNLANNGTINGDTSQQNQIQFNGTGVSTWTGSGDVSGGKIQLVVGSSSTLDISGLSTGIKFRSSGTMATSISGTLLAGTQVLNGNGNATCSFTLNSGATLSTANPNGISNGAVGTLNFAGTVTLNAGANYTLNGTAAQVTLGLPATVNNLTVDNSAGVTLSAPVTVNGTLALANGILITSGGTLATMGSAGSVTGSGYVSGPLAQVFSGVGAKTFLTGKGGNSRPVTLNYTVLSGISTVTVEQFESAMGGTLPAATSQFNDRYWTISQAGGSGFTFDLSLDGTGFSPAATPVILREGSPDASYTASLSSPAYTATGVNAFGNFGLGDFAPSPDKLAIITSPQTLTAGTLSGTLTVQLQASGGTPKSAPSDLTFTLSTTSSGGVFRNTSDSATISSVTILAGNNSASFKYRDTFAPGAPTITVSGGGVNPGTQVETITPGAASQLAFSTQPVDAFLGYTLPSVVVQVQDAFGNNLPDSGTNITLALNGGTLASGTLLQTSGGSGSVTFNDLMINQPGVGLSFTASAPGLTPANSTTFSVSSKAIVKKLNSTSMDQAASWIGSMVPTAFDTAVINTTSVGTAPNSSADLGGSAAWYGLLVNNWSAGTGYTIGGAAGGTLTLGKGGLVGTNVNHSLAVGCALALATNEVWNWSGTSGSLTLNGALDNGGYLLTLNGNQPITLAGAVTGAGGLVKGGANTLTVNGATSFAGATTVSNGVLFIAATSTLEGSSAVTVAGGTLAGNGTINSPVTVQGGGTLAPGTGIATLTVNSNLTLQTGSITAMEVNKDLGSSDVVTGINHVTYGGTLSVTNLSGTLAAGDTFTLFSAASASGNFSSIAGSPGTNLVWHFNPANGQLSVANALASNPTNITALVSGTMVTLSWPDDHLGWILQAQTNSLATGLSTNWVDVVGSETGTSTNITINRANPAVFFRLRLP